MKSSNLNLNNFYGKYSSGAKSGKNKNSFFLKKNISLIEKQIYKNCNKMGLNKNNLQNKIIMNVGSGREALALMQFNPKKIYHYDISKDNIDRFKKIIKQKKLSNKISSEKFDLSKNTLPKKKFDFIYLHGIIQHTKDINKSITNICNSLKINGYMWFYFYRPGSFVVFLGSLQRFLLKKTNLLYFLKYIKKNSDYDFIDGILDDCFVPIRQLFYSSDYMMFLRQNNMKIYGNSRLISNKKLDFLNFHESVVLFTRKINKQKSKPPLDIILKPGNDVDVLNPKNYKNNIKLSKILNCVYKMNIDQSQNINNIVKNIEILKLNFQKKISDRGFVTEKYLNSNLNKLLYYLNN